MNQYYKIHPWKIIEEGFNVNQQRASESVFSLGNGKMGMRANFEECYSGETLKGSYLAGIYYPDKTRVGWWKNGYPEYFAKVLNAPDFLSINIIVDSETLDLATWHITDFVRELDMENGVLNRSFIATSPVGKTIQVETQRFLSMTETNLALVKYSIKALSQNIEVEIVSRIDGDVMNEDSNYDEQFWNVEQTLCDSDKSYLQAATKKLDFKVGMSMNCKLDFNHDSPEVQKNYSIKEKQIAEKYKFEIDPGDKVTFEKYVAVVTSLDFDKEELNDKAVNFASKAMEKGYRSLLKDHTTWWHEKWKNCSIEIDGDDEAQQGIRFNIFHLYQTYTGTDPRLNIGPKGFTGEKYGGSTYWDTEAYCLPFYMSTAGDEVAYNLLMYRYKQLDKAIENAGKLGFNSGAALYPMVTMNGEECHNEWEITFEEIHRNGAIAYAIYYYTNYTGNTSYVENYGIEVLIGIARFWAQRVSYSKKAQKYMILGVTGPNEYENNVNNNWYTNYIAAWCLQYTAEMVNSLEENNKDKFQAVVQKTKFDTSTELSMWKAIYTNMHLPVDNELDIILQQDGYLDKEQKLAKELTQEERPINQNWSWDRILRSCFIKQADVMQGLFFFEEDFDYDVIKRNYEFYEPRTVHESSLSPCIYSIQASYLDKKEEAYNLYLRTSRLDLDDYNKEVHEGLHITSMAGTWMSIVMGFGGLRVRENRLHFTPRLPKQWKRLSFYINFRKRLLKVAITNESVDISLIKGKTLEVIINGNVVVIS
ncbi:MAG: family 65 glycosyl hydrolase domain-containing protein [Bacteroidales bacterium]|nr:family 65 glycosyl hydrolase domain-containing protein [Bacteroidales bacterium]